MCRLAKSQTTPLRSLRTPNLASAGSNEEAPVGWYWGFDGNLRSSPGGLNSSWIFPDSAILVVVEYQCTGLFWANSIKSPGPGGAGAGADDGYPQMGNVGR